MNSIESDYDNRVDVASLISNFDPSYKPTVPRKPARYINGRIVWMKDDDDNDNDSDGPDSCNISMKDRSDTDSDADNGINTKLNSITDECVNFIKLVLKALSSLMVS